MNAIILSALLAQAEPSVPNKLGVRPGDVIVGNLRLLFTDKAEQLDFERKDRVTLKVMQEATNQGIRTFSITHLINNLSIRMDDFKQENNKGADGIENTEVRSLLGHQVRFDSIGDDALGNMMVARMMTIPLPSKSVKVGGKWSFDFEGFKSYRFSAVYTAVESGKPAIKFTWTGEEKPLITASGTALIDPATGLPTKINLTAKNMALPGGELGPVESMKLDYTMTSFKRGL